MKKVSKYTAHQKLEHAELALQRQDVDEARECLRDAAELAPQVPGVDGTAASERWCHCVLTDSIRKFVYPVPTHRDG